MRTQRIALLAVALIFALTGCGGKAAGGSDPAGGPGGNAAEGYEGSLVTSGKYAATWKASPEAKAEVFNTVGSVTLTSDHQTFGNIGVKPDGSISFGSGAAELSPNVSYTGTGAKVTLDKSGQFVCAFSVDTDLTGNNNGAMLHLKGAMKVHWHPQGLGDLSCP
jgi:hypothetical protein